MIRTPWIQGGLLALVVSTWLGWAPPAAAQQSTLPANVVAPSKENRVIRNQLTLARKLEQQALDGITAGPPDNAVPIDPVALQAARDAYVLIRAARHGMGWQKEGKKLPDPLLDLVYQRVDKAWNLSRTPVDRKDMRRAEYIEVSVRDMTQAISLLDQVLVMMP